MFIVCLIKTQKIKQNIIGFIIIFIENMVLYPQYPQELVLFVAHYLRQKEKGISLTKISVAKNIGKGRKNK